MSDNRVSGLISAVAETLAEIQKPTIEIGPLNASKTVDIFAERKHQSWDKTLEARCDFAPHIGMTRRGGVRFLHLWRKSPLGRTLTDIKSDDGMIPFFAENICALLNDFLGEHLAIGSWCICTTPKRRHKERNFATLIAMEIGKRLSIPFYEDVALAPSKHRVGTVFTMNVLPQEPNIIVFDDFVTTGSTLQSMANLLRQYEKNLLFITGINNAM